MGKLIDLMIALIIMFVLPICWIVLEQRMITRQAIRKRTESQLEQVCKNGFIDLASYRLYVSELHAMGGYSAEVEGEGEASDKLLEELTSKGYFYFDHGELINIRVENKGELIYSSSGMVSGCA